VSEDANRCETDRDRRRRASRDKGLTEVVGEMRRTIQFDVGYDHRAFPEECGGGGHGQHGMTMGFLLQGPHGVVQWSVNMPNWVPGNVVHGGVPSEFLSAVPAYPQISDLYADSLGYHSPTPLHEWQKDYGRDDCMMLPDGICFYDESSLNAEPMLEAFLAHGPHAVWALLGDYYASTFTAVPHA
jgi:hypothetical protein